MEECNTPLISFSYGSWTRELKWLAESHRALSPWVAGQYRQVISRQLFKALFNNVRLYCCRTHQGQCPRIVRVRCANYSSSEGLKHKHRVAEPLMAMTRAQPACCRLDSPTSRPKRGSPSLPLAEKCVAQDEHPYRWFSPTEEVPHPYPVPSLLKGAGNWALRGVGALLSERGQA